MATIQTQCQVLLELVSWLFQKYSADVALHERADTVETASLDREMLKRE